MEIGQVSKDSVQPYRKRIIGVVGDKILLMNDMLVFMLVLSGHLCPRYFCGLW
jgi:hypothetical protein